MKKSLKIKTTVTMALVACFSLVFGLTMLASPATTAKADAPATFEMLGASVKYETAENANDNGIRFGVQLDKTAYAALAADENAEAGILICPKDQYTGSLMVETEKAIKGVVKGEQGLENVMIGTWTENADGYMQTWVYMTGIPEESFNRPISGRAYIDWNGDASDVSYSDTVTKAIADVALAVREDYEDENLYETTATQYDSLDDYLLNYDVKFIDAYGNEATQSVKYGDELEVAEDPAARTGYTFTGWFEKTGGSTYADTATDFSAENATTVKYAKTFKSQFNTTGNVFEKPAILKTLGGRGQGVNTVDADDFEWHAKGDYIFADTGVSKAEGFTITATFVPETGAEYGFAITDDLENGRGRIVYRMSNNKFNFYNYSSGEYGGGTWDWYDSKEDVTNSASALVAGTPATMSFVYSVDAFIVYINGVRACSFVDTDGLQSGSSRKIKDLVGSGDTVYLGFGAYNGPAEGTVITDWGFSKGVSDSVVRMLADLRAGGFTNNSDPNYNNPQFEVQATFKKSASGILGFMFRQAEWGRWCTFGYNTETGKFGYYRFGLTSQKREFTISNSTFDTGKDNTIKVVYKGDRILDVYINGTKMIFTDGRNNEFYLGWAYSGQEDSNKPFAWWGDISISTRKDMRVGVSHADAYDFSCTTTFVLYEEKSVADFDCALGDDNIFTNNNGTNDNNPQFEVSADFKYTENVDHYGIKFQQAGSSNYLVLAYNATTGRFGWYKNGTHAEYREYTMDNDAFVKEEGATNNVKVVYYGDRVVDVYINSVKMNFTNSRGGNSGSLYLGWNCTDSASNSSMTSGKPFEWWGTSTGAARATMNVSAYQSNVNTNKGEEGVSNLTLTITKAYGA